MKKYLWGMLFLLLSSACNSDSINQALDVADGVPRKTIDTDKLGANAFANDPYFGSPQQQFMEVSSTLGLHYVRILAHWDEGVDQGPGTAPDFGFLDALVASLPPNVDAILVMTGTPAWLNNSNSWIGGSPAATFVSEWVAPIAARYSSNPRVIGLQVWNEPNQDNPRNQLMGFTASPDEYVNMLKLASQTIRAAAPAKLVLTAATTAINQNFPASLDYNRAMRAAGAETVADLWAVHFYGKQYENVVRPGGVSDFVSGLNLPVWVTESGAQGVNSQLSYAEEVWPFLLDTMPNIERIYLYQFTEDSPPSITYGLRNKSSDAPVSDLYVWLRDNKK